VTVEIIPCYPSVAYVASPVVVATQTAESVDTFLPAVTLATQFNAALGQPLAKTQRKLAY